MAMTLKTELREAFASAVTAAGCIGYATSANERNNHKDAVAKARKRFDDAIAHLSAQAKVQVTDGDVSRACDAYDPYTEVGSAPKGMRLALESFAARLSYGVQSKLGQDDHTKPKDKAVFLSIGSPEAAIARLSQGAQGEAGRDAIADIQTFARAYRQEVPKAVLTVHGVSAGLEALGIYTRPAERMQGEAVDAGDALCQESDGCPTEMAVLKRFWRTNHDERAAVPEGMVLVTQEDGNNYCRILSLLGMEEEGDPIAAIEGLLSATPTLAGKGCAK